MNGDGLSSCRWKELAGHSFKLKKNTHLINRVASNRVASSVSGSAVNLYSVLCLQYCEIVFDRMEYTMKTSDTALVKA